MVGLAALDPPYKIAQFDHEQLVRPHAAPQQSGFAGQLASGWQKRVLFHDGVISANPA